MYLICETSIGRHWRELGLFWEGKLKFVQLYRTNTKNY